MTDPFSNPFDAPVQPSPVASHPEQHGNPFGGLGMQSHDQSSGTPGVVQAMENPFQQLGGNGQPAAQPAVHMHQQPQSPPGVAPMQQQTSSSAGSFAQPSPFDQYQQQQPPAYGQQPPAPSAQPFANGHVGQPPTSQPVNFQPKPFQPPAVGAASSFDSGPTPAMASADSSTESQSTPFDEAVASSQRSSAAAANPMLNQQQQQQNQPGVFGSQPAPSSFASQPSPHQAGSFAAPFNQQQQQQNPFAAQQPPQQQQPFQASPQHQAPPAAARENPFGTPPAQQPSPFGTPQQQQQSPFGTPQQQPPPQQQASPYSQPSPFGATQQPQSYYGAQPQGQSTALVPSQQPSNPYAGILQQQPAPAHDPFGSQALVPAAAHQGGQWSVGGGQPTAAAGSFTSQPVAQQPHAVPQQHPSGQPPHPGAAFPSNTAFPASQQHHPPQPYREESDRSAPPPVKEVGADNRDSGVSVVTEPETPSKQHRRDDLQTRPAPPVLAGNAARNKYSQALAQNAPPGASPLPRAELVRKRGYVLSRISFRTILMKKWKQSYWVQYGPHTMLWFRSQADFDDWLNNPYHSQAQRNFLIKLAVNFVHDLYKPNVRGYQVTQARTKNYGRDLVRQFKLERWMDYGPTIAAAFGSHTPSEVDELRAAIVECMRNTPLEGGIRATGAVRQNRPEYERSAQSEYGRPSGHMGRDNTSPYNNERASSERPPVSHPQPPPKREDLTIASADLLDDGFEDIDLASQGAQSMGGVPRGNDLFQPSPPPQQFGVQQSRSLVPSTAAPYAYPGAPPAPQQPGQPFGAPQRHFSHGPPASQPQQFQQPQQHFQQHQPQQPFQQQAYQQQQPHQFQQQQQFQQQSNRW